MRIAIVTDAWAPQVNGVVTTLRRTADTLQEKGHKVVVVNPEAFRTIPCPTYPGIRLALTPARKLGRMLDGFHPRAVHIATEGPLGLAARRYCLRRGIRFTSSYHTRFPEYLRMRVPIPLSWSYAYQRWFHGAAERTMVAAPSQARELESRGFRNLTIWSRGVDTELFRPREKSFLKDLRPIWMYVGRVAVEKNLEAYLGLDLPGTKYVVGDGPSVEGLRAQHPGVQFAGYRFGEDLARHLAAADVFVFPSRTDTFGLVLLEAMACGIPVAAYPVTGPVDIVQSGVTGVLSEDLGRAAREALLLEPTKCRELALQHTWEAASETFLRQLHRNRRYRAGFSRPASSGHRG